MLRITIDINTDHDTFQEDPQKEIKRLISKRLIESSIPHTPTKDIEYSTSIEGRLRAPDGNICGLITFTTS